MIKSSGFTLIEMVITMFLSCMVIMLLTKQYFLVKQQYLRVVTVINQQLEVQWVVDLLRSSIRQAGFTPCKSINRLASFDSRHPANIIVAISASKQPDVSLTIARMSPYFDRALRIMDSNQLEITAVSRIQNGDDILIADCHHAEVQTVAAIQGAKQGRLITLNKPLQFNYGYPIYVGVWIEERYFIHTNKTQQKTLYYEQKHHAEELSSHIDDMDIQLVNKAGATLVNLKLSAPQDKKLALQTRVRMP